jgi:hypothetical protein
MLSDPLFPTAAFLPLTDASAAGMPAAISWTYRDPLFDADDYTNYHNENETA